MPFFAQGYLSDRTVIRDLCRCRAEPRRGLLMRFVHTREQSMALRLRWRENRPTGQQRVSVAESRLFLRRRQRTHVLTTIQTYPLVASSLGIFVPKGLSRKSLNGLSVDTSDLSASLTYSNSAV